MSIVDIKLDARRALHGELAAPAYLYPDDTTITPEAAKGVTVRWHNQLARKGAMEDYTATIIEGVERLVFHSYYLFEADGVTPLVPARLNCVIIPGYQNATFSLDAREPSDGPEEIVWSAARMKPKVPAVPIP